MKRIFRAATRSEPVENMVRMEHIASQEYAVAGDNEPVRVLRDVSLLIRKGESWGISGLQAYEIRLLLEIMANIKPYDSGRCVLVERGMMRHKRIILRHIFYIGNSDMLYDNMNVLEFLMFAAARYGVVPVLLQDQLLETLVELGLGKIALTPIQYLSGEEKAVVALLTAAYSDCLILVFNLPEYDWPPELAESLAKIAEMIRSNGQTLILGTRGCELIQRACTHTAFLAEGRLLFSGTVDELLTKYDRTCVILRDRNIDRLLRALPPLLPDLTLTPRQDGTLLVGAPEGMACIPGEIYRRIGDAGVVPDGMEVHFKTVRNAFEELVKQYGLQK